MSTLLYPLPAAVYTKHPRLDLSSPRAGQSSINTWGNNKNANINQQAVPLC